MVVLQNTYKTWPLKLASLQLSVFAQLHAHRDRCNQFCHGKTQPLHQPSRLIPTLDEHHDGNHARKIASAHEPSCDESPSDQSLASAWH